MMCSILSKKIYTEKFKVGFLMRYVITALFIGLLPASAQETSKYVVCSQKAQTQMEMNICASNEAAEADKELNIIYHKLLLQVSGQKMVVAKIKSAERAWITYRDSYIDAMYPAGNKQEEYGSMYPLEVNLLRAKFARSQSTALELLLEQYSN